LATGIRSRSVPGCLRVAVIDRTGLKEPVLGSSVNQHRLFTAMH